MTEIQTHYETVCETRYTEKNVTEDTPICKNVVMSMCEDGITDPTIGKNCMNFTRRVRNYFFNNFDTEMMKSSNFHLFIYKAKGS